jgi:hypothetical protein
MAELYDLQTEELTASAWKKVAIGVILALLFHLGDALLGDHLAKNYKIRPAEIGKVNKDYLAMKFCKLQNVNCNTFYEIL